MRQLLPRPFGWLRFNYGARAPELTTAVGIVVNNHARAPELTPIVGIVVNNHARAHLLTAASFVAG